MYLEILAGDITHTYTCMPVHIIRGKQSMGNTYINLTENFVATVLGVISSTICRWFTCVCVCVCVWMCVRGHIS